MSSDAPGMLTADTPRARSSLLWTAARIAATGVVDTQDFTGAARGFLRRYKVNYVSVRDGTDKSYRAYGLTGVPETYFVDPRGRTVEHAVGAVSRRELTKSVEHLLKVSR